MGMRKFLVCCAMLAGLGSSALAADLPVKAPPPMAPPPFDWGGLYAGFGVSWFESHNRWQFGNPAPATLLPFTDTQDNFAWGLQGGAQWQFNQIVLGIEASYSNPASAFKGAISNGAVNSVCTANLGQACQLRMTSVSTVGGRAGWALGDWLIFGEGGWAAGTIDTQLVQTTGALFDSTRNSDFRNGWYAGGGINYAAYKSALMDVIIGVDYRHIDLRSHFEPSSADAFSGAPPGVNGRIVGGTADQVRFTVDVKTNGWGFMAPVVARY
jgi:outer membrane immunogenic protein